MGVKFDVGAGMDVDVAAAAAVIVGLMGTVAWLCAGAEEDEDEWNCEGLVDVVVDGCDAGELLLLLLPD